MGNDLRVILDDLKLSYDYLYKQQLFMSKKKYFLIISKII